MKLTVILTAILSLICLQDDVVSRHEHFLSYLPDGAYILLSYNDHTILRTAGIVRDYPDFFKSAKVPSYVPFKDAEATYSYSAISYDVAKRERELHKADPAAGRMPAPPGLDEQMYIVEIPGLSIHIETALKSGTIVESGENIGEARIYTTQQSYRNDRVTLHLVSPEPDVLLLSGSPELLRAMVLANRGEQTGFIDGASYAELMEYAGDSARWAMQFFDSINRSRESLYLRRGEDKEQLDAIDRTRARGPLLRVVRFDYSEEEYRQTDEQIFIDEEAAEAYYEMRKNPVSAGMVSGLPQREENKTPEEIAQYIEKLANRHILSREENRVISIMVYSAKDIAERDLLRKKYADYYEQIEKEREQAETEKIEKERQR